MVAANKIISCSSATNFAWVIPNYLSEMARTRWRRTSTSEVWEIVQFSNLIVPFIEAPCCESILFFRLTWDWMPLVGKILSLSISPEFVWVMFKAAGYSHLFCICLGHQCKFRFICKRCRSVECSIIVVSVKLKPLEIFVFLWTV